MPRKIYGDVAIYGCESSHECAHGFVVVANYTLLDRPPRLATASPLPNFVATHGKRDLKIAFRVRYPSPSEEISVL